MNKEIPRSVKAETGKPPSSSPPPQRGSVYTQTHTHTRANTHAGLLTGPFIFV